MHSAYFSARSSECDTQNSAYSDGKHHGDDVAAFTRNKPTMFPISRRVLWDREPIEAPHFIRSRDVLPPVYIPEDAAQSLLMESIHDATDKNKIQKTH